MSWTQPRTWVAGEVVTAALLNTHVRDNLQSGPVASSVSSLNALFNGNPVAGSRGYIQVGSTPYETVSLTYNATTTAWVQELPTLLVLMQANATTAGTTFTVAAQGPLMPHKIFTDAGLILNVRTIALLTAGASSSCIATCLASTGASAGALTLDTTHNTGSPTTNSTSANIQDSGWAALSGSVTPTTYVALSVGMERSGSNNGTVGAGTALWMRWTG